MATSKAIELLEPAQAKARLDGVLDRIRDGQKVTTDELLEAQALLALSSEKAQIEERARRRAEKQRRDQEAAQTHVMLNTEAPGLAQAVVDAAAPAVDAARTLAEAVRAYEALVVSAERKLPGGATGWPGSRGILDGLLKEIAVEASGGKASPTVLGLRRAVARATGAEVPPDPDEQGRADERARDERFQAAQRAKTDRHYARSTLRNAAHGVPFPARDLEWARGVLGDEEADRIIRDAKPAR